MKPLPPHPRSLRPSKPYHTSATRKAAARPKSGPVTNQKYEIEHQKSGSVLLAVTGMSPAILTETLWALANPADGAGAVIPDRVIVVTTREGQARLASLFQPARQLGEITPWDALRAALECRGHDLSGRLRFGMTSDDIRILTAVDPSTGCSRELDDVRTPAENDFAANFLLESVRGIVENPDTQLVASLAGGRKTMGALLYACMTLLGRETDRLTHILVSEPYETLRDFWFPAQPGGCIHPSTRPPAGPDDPAPAARQAYDPAAARVDLAEVPFVPLRNLFVRELGRKAGTFHRLVEECSQGLAQRAAENLKLTVETRHPEIDVNGTRIRLSPLEHLCLLFLARRTKHGEAAYGAYKDAVDDMNAFRTEQLAARKGPNDWLHADSLRAEWDDRSITKAVSGIREKLRDAGGDAAILASCLPRKGGCALHVAPSMIFIK